MSPSSHSAPSRNLLVSLLLGPAASLFADRRKPAGALSRLDARTLADLGIAHVGQGPATLHVAMTDTGRQDVTTSVGVPPARCQRALPRPGGCLPISPPVA